MARTPFSPPDANIVVSSDGYFDVYPPADRSNGDKPAYRGHLSELGTGIRGADDRLRAAQKVLAEQLQEAPVKEIRKAIGINDRYLFIN